MARFNAKTRPNPSEYMDAKESVEKKSANASRRFAEIVLQHICNLTIRVRTSSAQSFARQWAIYQQVRYQKYTRAFSHEDTPQLWEETTCRF